LLRTKTLRSDSSEEDSFAIERALFAQGYPVVAGTDEAGRGPLAGPVVAACVVLPSVCAHQQFRDSKTLSAGVRADLVARLGEIGALVGVGVVSASEIDRINILQASLLAMKKAVEALPFTPDFLLVDGKFQVGLPLPQQALVRGDSRSASIAAASIVAKVTRDSLMEQYHKQYPQYGFHRHKGYPTAEHRRILEEIGPCAIHRRSFQPVRQWLATE